MAAGADMDMNTAAFGRKLYDIRREQNLSSDRLAELCGINPVFLRQIESNTRLPSLRKFVRLCNKLRVAPNYFLVDSLLWDEEDTIAALNSKLRALSPRQLNLVMETVNTLIENVSVFEEPEQE